MTVITKPVSSYKDDKTKESLVHNYEHQRPLSSIAAELKSSPNRDCDVEAESLASSEENDYRTSTRRPFCSNACLMATVFVAFCLAFIGAAYMIRQLSGAHHFRGHCKIPYYSSLNKDPMISGQFSNPSVNGIKPLKPVFDQELVGERFGLVERVDSDGLVEFDYELDLDFDEFEALELPEISHGRYIHDFKVNKTAIIDVDGKRCFLMPLDPVSVPRPRNVMDVIENLRDGKYELDIDEIRVDTRIVLPPIKDIKSYGIYIFGECFDKTSYELQMVEQNVIVKRSAHDESAEHFQFVEFTGKRMIKYNILNLDEA